MRWSIQHVHGAALTPAAACARMAGDLFTLHHWLRILPPRPQRPPPAQMVDPSHNEGHKMRHAVWSHLRLALAVVHYMHDCLRAHWGILAAQEPSAPPATKDALASWAVQVPSTPKPLWTVAAAYPSFSPFFLVTGAAAQP